MSLRHRQIKGTALNFIAVVFNQGSTLVANIFVARILMQQSFGEYFMVQATLLTMSALSQLATGYTASKYIAELRSVDPERAGRIMGVCAIVSIVMAVVGTLLVVAMAPWLAGAMLNAPHLASALILGAGFLLFSSINGYQTGALSGLEAYASLAKAGAASGIVAMVAISLGAWWGGLNGALIGLSVSAIFRCGIHYRLLRIESRTHGIRPQYRGSLRREKTIIVKFAFPAAMAGFFLTPMIWLANTFLVRQQDGYVEMALYAAATNFRIAVLFLPNVMNNVGMSILNNEKARGDLKHYHRLFSANVLHIFLVSLGGALVVGILGRPLLELFGKDFGAGYLILWFLLAASVSDAVSIGMYQYMQSQAKIWHALIGITIPTGLFLVAAAYFLVPMYGGAGLAIATMVTSILGLICHMTLVALLRRRVGMEAGTHSCRDIGARR